MTSIQNNQQSRQNALMAYQMPTQSREEIPENPFKYTKISDAGALDMRQAFQTLTPEFNAADSNHDGSLDMSELTKFSGDPSGKTAQAFLDIFDQPDPTTGKPDGNINLPEYTVYKMVQDQAYGSLDGVISPEGMDQINSDIPNPDGATRQHLKDQAKNLFATYFNPKK